MQMHRSLLAALFLAALLLGPGIRPASADEAAQASAVLGGACTAAGSMREGAEGVQRAP